MKKILLVISFFITLITYAQTTSKWSDLFSYNNVLKIREDNDRLIAAADNGIFYYYPSTGEIKKLSKANGLHEVQISAFDYDAATQTGIIGYQNGSMDVITPNGIFLIVDIPLATGYSGPKKINHISINGDRAIISAGYGVSIFNISKREFGDSAFFKKTDNSGNYDASNSAVIQGNVIYAATDAGIKYHEINATFPVYSSWSTLVNGAFKKMDASGTIVFATNNQVRYGTGNSFATIPGFSDIRDVRIKDNKIIVTDQTQVYIYGTNGSLQKNFNAEEEINTALVYNNTIYTGTKSTGIYNEQKASFKPDGPYRNTASRLSLLNNQIWVATGKRASNDVASSPSYLGYYHFDGNKWTYPDYFLQNLNVTFNIMDVVPNPSNPSEVFFTNYTHTTSKGIYKMVNDAFSKNYFVVNSYADPDYAYFDRPVGCVFDEKNNLFCTVSHTSKATKLGYYYFNRSTDNFVLNELALKQNVQKPTAKDGVLYVPVPLGDGGMLLYNYNDTPANISDDSFKFLNKNNNLPNSRTITGAIDKNDDLWIGTIEGLRVLSNPKSSILEDSPQTEDIVIEENGLPEELFRDFNILQITPDSGNQKWVSLDGGGVFYLSSNGDKTIYHFTRSNSPLPNDTVTDIKIDEKTGKVYFATLDGIMVYQGDVTEVTSNFGEVLVYPNPVVYAQYKGNVRIRGLAAKANIRITDAAGNLVHSAIANGGYFEWNLANQRGVRVASGIYYVLMTNEDGTDTATAKIAVVN